MIRVAIIEDNQTIRESLAYFVQTASDCQCVFACRTAEEALQELSTHQCQVVLMDIQLPKMSGIECTARLKQLFPSLQIIMVTVYEDTERISAALRAGALRLLAQTLQTERTRRRRPRGMPGRRAHATRNCA